MAGKITGVAVLTTNNEIVSLPAPNRHSNVLWTVIGEYESKKMAMVKGTQGFVDEDGEFLDRKESVIRAMEFSQISRPKKTSPENLLFSEDLW